MILFLLLLIISYLFGSIPTSYLLGKWLKKIDIRKYGSGNVGGTNAFRVLGTKPAIVTIIVDMGKGFVPAFFLAGWLGNDVGLPFIWTQILAGLASVIGHIWTVFLNFRGGKGVATGAGVLFALVPLATFVSVLAFFGIVALTRYVSLGSILAACLIPVTVSIQIFVFKASLPIELLILGLILAVTVTVTHRSNIMRLARGEERKLSEKKSPE